MSNNDRFKELAQRLAKRVGELEGVGPAPTLSIVSNVFEIRPNATHHGWTEIERESRIRWLRALRRHLKYMQVELFFEQALVGKRDLEDLSDEEIVDLHRTIDKARDHFHNSDGVSYYEAGLLRPQEEVA
jgi:hypothetical protein